MGEIYELQAYKQLLQVTENILNELSPEQQILKKYQILKKSILAKAKPSPIPPQSSQPQSSLSTIPTKLLSSYKLLTKNLLQCITQFQSEIEGEMNKESFLKNTHRMMKQIEKQCRVLGEELGHFGDGKAADRGVKLMVKEEVNSVRFLGKELEGKIQNMGLMLEVHRKMHEIILEAAEKEAKTTQKQLEYNRRLTEMEQAVEQVNDVKKFIQSFQMTQKKARRFQLARKNLAKVLFNI